MKLFNFVPTRYIDPFSQVGSCEVRIIRASRHTIKLKKYLSTNVFFLAKFTTGENRKHPLLGGYAKSRQALQKKEW